MSLTAAAAATAAAGKCEEENFHGTHHGNVSQTHKFDF
jgi:hypothetical protein